MTKEEDEMRKAVLKINSFWEFMAFAYAYRRKEILLTTNVIQFIFIVILLSKYTTLFESFIGFFAGLMS